MSLIRTITIFAVVVSQLPLVSTYGRGRSTPWVCRYTNCLERFDSCRDTCRQKPVKKCRERCLESFTVCYKLRLECIEHPEEFVLFFSGRRERVGESIEGCFESVFRPRGRR